MEEKTGTKMERGGEEAEKRMRKETEGTVRVAVRAVGAVKLEAVKEAVEVIVDK